MPGKKLSPRNRSSEEENYSEEFESDSSLELNSRRNTYRKRPQRKPYLKQRQNDSHDSTEKNQRDKEKNEKRPPIIKIFRRIDRKAKNIYLVDDKIEVWNKIVPPVSKSDSHISNWEKNPHSEEATCEISLFNSSGLPLRKTMERSTRTVKEVNKANDVEVAVWNLPGDDDTSCSSSTSTCKTAEKFDTHDQNYSCNEEDLYSPVTDISETSDSDDTLNKPHNVHDLYSPVTDISETPGRDYAYNTNYAYSPVTDVSETPGREDIWNDPSNADGLYSPVTDVSVAPDRDDDWNKPCNTYNLYSPVTDVSVTPGRDDDWNKPCETYDLNSQVTGVVQAPDKKNVINQPCEAQDFYSLVTDIAQKHKADVWSQPRNKEMFYPSETNTDQTLSRSNIYNQRFSSVFDSPDSSETDIDQTHNRDNAYSQRLDNHFVFPETPVIDTEQSGKYGSFDTLYRDPNVLSTDENLNIKSFNLNFTLNSDHDASYLLSSNDLISG